MKISKQQDIKLYEPDFDNIKTVWELCELLKSLYITMNYDLNDEIQSKEVKRLLDIKIIKEVKAKLINTQ